MIKITGIGWITQKKYGCIIRKYNRPYANIKSLYSQLREESVLTDNIKNFARFNDVSKITCCAAGLALYDAGMLSPARSKDDVGLIGTSTDGCLQSNLHYFQDYIENGRTLARGGLFSYTLPSSPMADAAINFGLKGPLIYMAFQQKQVPLLLQQAKTMIQEKEASVMLAIKADQERAICFICEKNRGLLLENAFKLQEIIHVTDNFSSLREIISVLEKGCL